MTSELGNTILGLLGEVEDGSAFDCMDITRLLRKKRNVTVDWHPVADFLDYVHRLGLLVIVQPGGFTRYRRCEKKDLAKAYTAVVEAMMKDSFRKDAVTDVQTVQEFADRYYRPERYTGRGADYAALCVKSLVEMVQKHGYCWLSHHESRTGNVVAFFPPQ